MGKVALQLFIRATWQCPNAKVQEDKGLDREIQIYIIQVRKTSEVNSVPEEQRGNIRDCPERG